MLIAGHKGGILVVRKEEHAVYNWRIKALHYNITNVLLPTSRATEAFQPQAYRV